MIELTEGAQSSCHDRRFCLRCVVVTRVGQSYGGTEKEAVTRYKTSKLHNSQHNISRPRPAKSCSDQIHIQSSVPASCPEYYILATFLTKNCIVFKRIISFGTPSLEFTRNCENKSKMSSVLRKTMHHDFTVQPTKNIKQYSPCKPWCPAEKSVAMANCKFWIMESNRVCKL